MRSVQPDILTTDYEQAMRMAAKRVWPQVRTPGCVFHFRQALRRNYLKRVKKVKLPASKINRNAFILREH